MSDPADLGRSERKSGCRDGASEVLPRAADALGKLGEHAAPAVPALTKRLEDGTAGPEGTVRGIGTRGSAPEDRFEP